METLEIKVNDKVLINICVKSRVILIKNYTSDECVITVTYPEKWFYTRALQHALSIVECTQSNNTIK